MTTPTNNLAERIRLTILLLQSLHDYFPYPETATGKTVRRSALHGVAPTRKHPCQTCAGAGTIRNKWACQHCEGRGWHHIDDYTQQPVGSTETDVIPHQHRVSCDACSGEGFETVEMQFLADVRLLCPVCQGLRFKPEVLAVERAGVSIADVLEMTVERALETFKSEAPIQRALGPLSLLGLGYLRIGQPLTTLSGG